MVAELARFVLQNISHFHDCHNRLYDDDVDNRLYDDDFDNLLYDEDFVAIGT